MIKHRNIGDRKSEYAKSGKKCSRKCLKLVFSVLTKANHKEMPCSGFPFLCNAVVAAAFLDEFSFSVTVDAEAWDAFLYRC